jgi:hypothetical protein
MKMQDKSSGVSIANKFRADATTSFLAGTVHEELKGVTTLAEWVRRTPEENRAAICAKIKEDCVSMKPPEAFRVHGHSMSGQTSALHDFCCHAAVSIAAQGLCRPSTEAPVAMAYEASKTMLKDLSDGPSGEFFESFEWCSDDGLLRPLAMPILAELLHGYGYQ